MRLSFFLLLVLTVPLAIPLFFTPSPPLIAEVPQRARVLGYDRSEFGASWAQVGGCTVREHLVSASFHAPRCASPEEGTLANIVDPYTGEKLDPSSPMEIDHLIPLAAAWDLGAHAWTHEQRESFANDPRNLVLTSSAANREKSDSLPSEWMPTHRANRCWYSRRLAEVAQAYELALPTKDLKEMGRACLWQGFTPSAPALNGH